MKTMRTAVISFLLLGILSLGGFPAGEATDYLGQYCWQVTSPGPGGSAVVKAAVTHMGDGHYLLNGKITNPLGIVEVFVGAAEVSGSSVYMTTTSAGSDSSGTWTFIGRFVLSFATLNGSGELLGDFHSTSSPNPQNASVEYQGPVTATFIPCP